MIHDNLGDRMKVYENVNRHYLTKRLPLVIRLDGCHFHTFAKSFKKPHDSLLTDTMEKTAMYLCKNISGCKLAYTQSDEITLLVTNDDTLETQPWFDNNLQKIVSVSASMATLAFNKFYKENVENNFESTSSLLTDEYRKYSSREDTATFDSRAFILPSNEVNNMFYWRQLDCIRNCIQSVAQANFSSKELHGLSCNQLKGKLLSEKNIDTNKYPIHLLYGTCIVREPEQLETGKIRYRWIIDHNIPLFSSDVNYINKEVFHV